MEAPAAQQAQVQAQAAVHVGGDLMWRHRGWEGPAGLEVQHRATTSEPADGHICVHQVDL